MHPNAALLHTLFTSLDRHDHRTMVRCYRPDATFRDIAFRLTGQKEIHAMWHMICVGDIRVAIKDVEADDRAGRARIVDTYTLRDKRQRPRKVVNEIESRFTFDGGLIVSQADDCDPVRWASMAFGGVKGFLAGHSRVVRSYAARKKLEEFITRNPEYK